MKAITKITYPAFSLVSLACFALSPQARATCQDGCLTNDNTVQGDDALINLTSGSDNTAVGFEALYLDTEGFSNTAIGVHTLNHNTTGYDNVATGVDALYSNTIGIWNTAIGDFALYNNTLGNHNTATGSGALEENTQGGGNTATGWSALGTNTTGTGNTAVGYNALFDSRRGSFNIALGNEAGMNVTGSNNIDIGSQGGAGDSGTIRIGTEGTHTATFVAGIRETPIGGAAQVGINANGQLGVRASSARFKEAIKAMDKSSEAILALRPVTFRYKHDLDPEGIPQFGLVAEEVEKVNPDLVARDEQGKPYTVRYEAVNAMLFNEFLKEHQTVQELKKQVAELTAGLRKVSAQVELSKPTTQTVLSNN